MNMSRDDTGKAYHSQPNLKELKAQTFAYIFNISKARCIKTHMKSKS